MFIPRFAIADLQNWKGDVRDKKRRKPLLVRGARQVGKTSLIQEFGRGSFKNVITLNLEREDHKSLFKEVGKTKNLIEQIELKFQQSIVPQHTLLFLDEIQESDVAIQQLRYFHEDAPNLHVIAAGSFLEAALKEKHLPFPVGRVENIFVWPLCFDEFLEAINASRSNARIWQYVASGQAIDEVTHTILMEQFREYLRVGGMPEAVAHYAQVRHLDDTLQSIYSSLELGFQDDVYKYASKSHAPYIRHVIDQAPRFAGRLVTYERFAGSSFKSREISAAFATLEGALVLRRVFPTTSVQPPWELKLKRKPKLIFLDSGLVCHKLGAWEALLGKIELNDLFQGQLAEQIIGQTLLSTSRLQPRNLSFWMREKAGATAEVDFLVAVGSELVPIEVKSGKSGRLRSLHQFMEDTKSTLGVCFNGFPPRLEETRTPKGKKFRILFLPYYLARHLEEILKRVK